MNIEHLKYLVAVVDCQSISSASRQLHLKQQYLSSIVKNMEKHFGVTLFERHARGITLTKDGQYIIAKAREIIKQANEMEADFLYPSKRNTSNVVDKITIYSVALLNSKILIDSIQLFNELFPNVAVSIKMDSLDEICSVMSRDVKSVAYVAIFEPLEEFEANLPEDIQILHSYETNISILAGAKNPIAQKYLSMTIQELLECELITYAPYGTGEDAYLYQILSRYGTPKIKYTVDNSAFLISLLQSGNFYAIGSQTIAQSEDLLTIPLKLDVSICSGVLVHREAMQLDIMKNFTDILLLQRDK